MDIVFLNKSKSILVFVCKVTNKRVKTQIYLQFSEHRHMRMKILSYTAPLQSKCLATSLPAPQLPPQRGKSPPPAC